MEVKAWGYHLVVDCQSCNSNVKAAGPLREFVRELVDRIDMKAYGLPTVEHFAKHDPEKAGFTLVQLIETSSITGHFVDKNGDAYLDVFSCKPFEVDAVIEVIQKWFKPERVKVFVLTRDAR